MPFLIVFLFLGFEATQWLHANAGIDTNPVVLAVMIYFIPAIMAILRRRSPIAVAVINTLFGWTVVGWFVAFIWAVS